ncbi:MAG: hypothetical protein ACLQQ4_07930 [Bacteroidia bacterium]
MRDSNNIYRIQDLLEIIERTDKMIQFHKTHGSVFMREQYEYRKEESMKELLNELTNSKSNLSVIMLSLKKFYPQLIKMAKKEKVKKGKQKELETLQEVFA